MNESMSRNPEEKEKDPIPIYFEMNNCALTCPKLTDLMVAQVSCDWPTPGHVTPCSPLIGPGLPRLRGHLRGHPVRADRAEALQGLARPEEGRAAQGQHQCHR